ncbi:hypothetical protein WJX74_001583 [Apatococcus lobatus]|uniref:Uncharacterized protein n=1 Tax=Apatococcus lobatus TaxID=904363 RepID=A0AAW1R120_9CHLO
MKLLSPAEPAELDGFHTCTGQVSCNLLVPDQLPAWLTILSPAGFHYYWGREPQVLTSQAPAELKHQQSVLPCQIREAYLSESLPKLELPTWNCSAKALRPAPEEDRAFVIQGDRIIGVARDLLKLKVQYLDDDWLACRRRLPPLPNGASRIPCRTWDLAFPRAPPPPLRIWAATFFGSSTQPLKKPQHLLKDSVRRPLLL